MWNKKHNVNQKFCPRHFLDAMQTLIRDKTESAISRSFFMLCMTSPVRLDLYLITVDMQTACLSVLNAKLS